MINSKIYPRVLNNLKLYSAVLEDRQCDVNKYSYSINTIFLILNGIRKESIMGYPNRFLLYIFDGDKLIKTKKFRGYDYKCIWLPFM
jgi:hypothetical protein